MLNEILLIGSIIVIYGMTLVLYRIFGKQGLYTFTIIATISANIEVLIVINAFGMARQTTDILISYNDNEYYTDYVEQGNTERKVGYETIIPAIYRAYKENYKIIFLNNG